MQTSFALSLATLLRILIFALLMLSATVAKTQEDDDTIDVLAAAGLPLMAFGAAWAVEDYEGMGQFALVFAGSHLTTKSLNRISDRECPDGEETCFASDHATSAFAGAAFLHRRYGWRSGLPAYALATASSINRVRDGHHRWQDVAAGAVVSIGLSYWLTEPHREFGLVPIANGGMMFFSMRF